MFAFPQIVNLEKLRGMFLSLEFLVLLVSSVAKCAYCLFIYAVVGICVVGF